MTINHHYAEVNGIRLHYASAGRGKLILFLHGFPAFWYDWKDQLLDLGCEYQAVAPDMRGYNLSSRPTDIDQYHLRHLVADIRCLTEHLGQEKFILVGHDFGGLIAWIFAAHHPKRVEKLVILNAPNPAVFERELRDNPAQQLACGYMKLYNTPIVAERELSQNNFAWLYRVVLEQGITQGYRTEEDAKEYLATWSQPGALTACLNYYRANHLCPATENCGSWSAWEQMPELTSPVVTAPTLVLWGLKDKGLLAGNLSGLKKFVPNLTVELFTDVGHWIAQAKAKEVNARIRDFLRNEISPVVRWSGGASDWGWGGLRP
jgi:pimeloyl-ACP methyl ester carboxylesterase